MWNWRLTFAKGAVVGVLAMLAVIGADIHAVPAWWAVPAAMVVEAIRDGLKAAFGAFAQES